jgi:hypothetical protein
VFRIDIKGRFECSELCREREESEGKKQGRKDQSRLQDLWDVERDRLACKQV